MDPLLGQKSKQAGVDGTMKTQTVACIFQAERRTKLNLPEIALASVKNQKETRHEKNDQATRQYIAVNNVGKSLKQNILFPFILKCLITQKVGHSFAIYVEKDSDCQVLFAGIKSFILRKNRTNVTSATNVLIDRQH